MIIIKLSADLASFRKKKLAQGARIGFVPTMGALHSGHLSLIQKSKELCDFTVCSIFVNPTQFNNPDDFKKYPVTLEKDIFKLEKNGCDVLFLPEVKEIYPEGLSVEKKFDIGYLENILEGKYRPGHFQGVCNVVERLVRIAEPDNIFLGQKDYQQCLVLKKLFTLLDNKIIIHICPTLREPDGLALSSRNLRLNEAERNAAPEIFKTLSFIKKNILKKDIDYLKKIAISFLEEKSFKVDYVEIADAKNLEPVNEWASKNDIVILAAAFINDIRLIDNMIMNAS